MAIPKAKLDQPKKKKTLWGRLKNSALFVLLMVIVITALIVLLIIMISRLLSTGKVF
jgi:hypothetical protein